jgi:hypothetical protein
MIILWKYRIPNLEALKRANTTSTKIIRAQIYWTDHLIKVLPKYMFQIYSYNSNLSYRVVDPFSAHIFCKCLESSPKHVVIDVIITRSFQNGML